MSTFDRFEFVPARVVCANRLPEHRVCSNTYAAAQRAAQQAVRFMRPKRDSEQRRRARKTQRAARRANR